MKKIIVSMLVFIGGAVSASDLLYGRSLMNQDAIKILAEGKIIHSESKEENPAFLQGLLRYPTSWNVIYDNNLWFCVKIDIYSTDVHNLNCHETIYKN